MRWGFLWLTLRLIMKQRLRTITLFCGIFFSSFLLNAFGSLGYYFWTQVHEGNSDTSTFNSTELALTVLAGGFFSIFFFFIGGDTSNNSFGMFCSSSS